MIDKVRIGPLDFDVVENSYVNPGNGDITHYGQITYSTTQISLHDGMSPGVKVVTLLHEIIHGVLSASGLQDHDPFEREIDALSHGLVAVFRDNPELCKVLSLQFTPEEKADGTS